MQPVVLAIGQIEMRLGQLARRNVARPKPVRHVVGEEAREVGHSPPRIAGTTMNDPSLSAALPSTASTGSDGRVVSSRRMFSSSIVWAVGAIWSVGTVARIAYWSR